MTFKLRRWSIQVDRDVLVWIAVLLCLVNIILVSVLAGTGVLRTAQPGDIERTQATTIDGERVTLPADSPGFVIENPTDADVFYNVVLHVSNGGPLYTGTGSEPFVQLRFNYFPITLGLFWALAVFGYAVTKIGLLVISIAATAGGTYLLLRAETKHRGVDLSSQAAVGLGIASLGFQPMVANFKVGQTTPIIYAFIALAWWYYRQGVNSLGGAAVVGATLFKPYFGAPLVMFARRDRISGIAGFIATYAAANVLAVLTVGPENLISYYAILVEFILSEGVAENYDSFDAWSASHFRPFYWLGSMTPVARALFVLPPAYAAVEYVRGDRDADTVVAVALISLLLVLETTTAIDMAIALVPLVLLGARYYQTAPQYLVLLVVALTLMQAHAYTLEILVGVGPKVFKPLAASESVILAVLPILQPGSYATLILLWLGLITPGRYS